MTRNQLKLILLFAVFLGPLLAAFLWYYGLGETYAPSGRTNHAPLVSPAIPLKPFANVIHSARSTDAQFDLGSLKRRWSVLHPLAESCRQRCQKSLYNTRQVRLALGKDGNRVQRILLSPNPGLLNRLSTDHPDSIRLLEARRGIEKQLPPILRNHPIGPDDALLIDPLGNLMMIIPATLAPRELLKDLKRLLKLSRIG